MRLICLPYAGAAASIYRQWPAGFDPDVEVLGVQLPGRATRIWEPALTSLPVLVDRLAASLEPWIDRPYALFGHSMGALIAYELARALEARALPGPSHLFVSGQSAPHRPNREPSLHGLPDDELLAALRTLTARSDDAMDNAELMRLLLPTLRADCTLCAAYEWTAAAPLTCMLTAFGGRDDRSVTRADLGAWRRHTTGPFDLRIFPGDHFFVHSARASVLRAVRARLRRTAASAARPFARTPGLHRRSPR
jgi:medium-chain acyl-[acyl-carrier-protein] hydrolase